MATVMLSPSIGLVCYLTCRPDADSAIFAANLSVRKMGHGEEYHQGGFFDRCKLHIT